MISQRDSLFVVLSSVSSSHLAVSSVFQHVSVLLSHPKVPVVVQQFSTDSNSFNQFQLRVFQVCGNHQALVTVCRFLRLGQRGCRRRPVLQYRPVERAWHRAEKSERERPSLLLIATLATADLLLHFLPFSLRFSPFLASFISCGEEKMRG